MEVVRAVPTAAGTQTCKPFGTYVIKAIFIDLSKNDDDIAGTESEFSLLGWKQS